MEFAMKLLLYLASNISAVNFYLSAALSTPSGEVWAVFKQKFKSSSYTSYSLRHRCTFSKIAVQKAWITKLISEIK